eukprot:2396617-Amphidinium_carterae.1
MESHEQKVVLVGSHLGLTQRAFAGCMTKQNPFGQCCLQCERPHSFKSKTYPYLLLVCGVPPAGRFSV